MSDQAPQYRTVPTPPALPSEAAGPQKLPLLSELLNYAPAVRVHLMGATDKAPLSVLDYPITGPAYRERIRNNTGSVAVILDQNETGVGYNYPVLVRTLCWDLADALIRAEKAESRLHQEQQDAADMKEQRLAAGGILEFMPGVFALPTAEDGDSTRQNIIASERRRILKWHASLCEALGFPALDIRVPGFGIPEVAASLPVQGEPVGPPLCACGNETLSIVSGICLSCAALI